MPWYSVNTSIMNQSLKTSTPGVKQVWLANDSAGSGQIVPLYNWYDHLSQEGKKYDYLVNGSNSWLIVKSDVLADEAKRVFTIEGQRHLGAVIGSQKFKDQYCREKHYLRCKEPASYNLPCFLEGLQIQVYLFHAHNKVV